MSIGEREGLIARIRQIRRSVAATKPLASTARRPDDAAVRSLEARIAHLEQVVNGLQDSVHRESRRQGKLISELQAQVQPAALGRALSQDAEERGL